MGVPQLVQRTELAACKRYALEYLLKSRRERVDLFLGTAIVGLTLDEITKKFHFF